MSKVYYIASGSVRGTCDHRHATAGDAWKCCHRDSEQCGKLGGGSYSDREVKRSDGNEMTDADMASIDAAQEKVFGC
jgi:hypothetical protein